MTIDGKSDLQKSNAITAHTGLKHLKLVLVGDTTVGKSCLITNYLQNKFDENYEPTVLDVYTGQKNLNKKLVNIEIQDTSGDEYFGTNRKVQYKDADCFMICVAVNSESSFKSVDQWTNEIHQVEADKPIMLILTKKDLSYETEEPVTIEDL